MENDDKKLLLLDLDNTIICAEELPSSNDEQSPINDKLIKAREEFRTVRMEDYDDIFERPHLQEFLDYVFEHFNVGIWTASSKEYAIFIVKNFITISNDESKHNRDIKLFLCSYHCNVSKKNFKQTKDLKLISDKWNLKNHEDIILIDDLEQLAEHQPNNVILVKPFFYDKEEAYNDDELIKVKLKLEATLKNQKK